MISKCYTYIVWHYEHFHIYNQMPTDLWWQVAPPARWRSGLSLKNPCKYLCHYQYFKLWFLFLNEILYGTMNNFRYITKCLLTSGGRCMVPPARWRSGLSLKNPCKCPNLCHYQFLKLWFLNDILVLYGTMNNMNTMAIWTLSDIWPLVAGGTTCQVMVRLITEKSPWMAKSAKVAFWSITENSLSSKKI